MPHPPGPSVGVGDGVCVVALGVVERAETEVGVTRALTDGASEEADDTAAITPPRAAAAAQTQSQRLTARGSYRRSDQELGSTMQVQFSTTVSLSPVLTSVIWATRYPEPSAFTCAEKSVGSVVAHSELPKVALSSRTVVG